MHFVRGRHVCFELACESIMRALSRSPPSKMIDCRIAQGSIEPRYNAFVGRRLFGTRNDLRKCVLENIFSQRAVTYASFKITKERALIFDQNGDRGRMLGRVHCSIVRRSDVKFCAFDSDPPHVQNASVRAAKGQTLLLLAILAFAPCLGVCSGWTASAEARMACCMGKSSDEATMCCASSEGRQNADGAGAIAIAGLPVRDHITFQIAAALAPEMRRALVTESDVPPTTDSDRHILLSVFLI